MVSGAPTGPQFEDEVRNIARSLYSNSLGQGSQLFDGRERDGVFWNGHFYTVVEATTWRTKEKAEIDGKKTHELVNKIRQSGHMAQGFLVTLHEPTPDQKNVIKQRKYDKTTRIISFDELRSQLFDALTYINNREKKRFGSVYDHVDNNFDIPLADFVEPTVQNIENSELVSFSDMVERTLSGQRCVLIAEYGVGKSMLLRHVFHKLVSKVRSKKHFRTPVAINLREHLGQTDPVELLERHARANAVDPQRLVAAWNAGYIDLLIDGFDELSTRGWTGDIRRLKEYKRTSHAVVRKLVKETPSGCSIVIAGRDAYFDSIAEMREALGAPKSQFSVLRVFPFDEAQATEFLNKKNFSGALPDWIPTRPLLLTYLVTKGLLQAAVGAEASGDFPRGSAWLSLIEMIASRESDQLEGVDKDALIEFLGALAIRSRQTSGSQASFSPQQMESIFTDVTGNSIMEDERNLLLRLPGLGAAQDNALNRSFIDSDFMNVCCSTPVMNYIRNPYSDYSKTYAFENLGEPMSDVGLEALATSLSRQRIQHGVAYASMNRAVETKLSQLAYDVFRATRMVHSVRESLSFDGIAIDEVDLSEGGFDDCSIVFTGCIIDRIILPLPEDTNVNVKFIDCLVGRIEGRVSFADLSKEQFVDCEVGEFTDEYSVNSQILETSLPLGVRVLIVTLRKLFTQGGSSRLESALYRGLDQRSKMVVTDVIALLLRHRFIVETGRKGKITYAGTKVKRGEALSIIQSPNMSNSTLVRDCMNL